MRPSFFRMSWRNNFVCCDCCVHTSCKMGLSITVSVPLFHVLGSLLISKALMFLLFFVRISLQTASSHRLAKPVFLIVSVSTINGSYDMLLQEGEYSQKEKAVKKKFEIYSTAYWCIATAIYLGWSFLSVRWDYTWILWPVAGVLFGAVSVVARGIWGTQDSTRI